VTGSLVWDTVETAKLLGSCDTILGAGNTASCPFPLFLADISELILIFSHWFFQQSSTAWIKRRSKEKS